MTIARMIPAVLLAMLLVCGGCSRYARSINTLYSPVTQVQGGGGLLYVVMPADQQTPSPALKWVVGAVKDEDGNTVDELYSARSPAELTQAALVQELRHAGYTVTPSSSPPATPVSQVRVTRATLNLDQTAAPLSLKASCRLTVALEVWKEGQLLRKLEYEATYSDTNVKEREVLAETVLRETLQAMMRRAVPELVGVLQGTGR